MIHPKLNDEDIVKLATLKVQEEQPHNHLWYRINATRRIGGSMKLTPTFDQTLQEVLNQTPPHLCEKMTFTLMFVVYFF